MPTKTQQRTSRRPKTPKTRGQEKKSSNGGIIRAPVSLNKSSRQSGPPSYRPPRTTERILTVDGSTIFANVATVPTQPGLSQSFPWLSGIANSFELYRVHSLTFRYKNIVGTSNNGNVILSYDLDVLDLPPTSGTVASQSTFYKDGAPWRVFELKVKIPNKTYFTRNGNVSGADPKMYDCGVLHISTEGCTEAPQGYLEVEYDIELSGKQPAGSATNTFNGSPMFSLKQTIPQDIALGVNPITWSSALVQVNSLAIEFIDEFSFSVPSTGHYQYSYTWASNSSITNCYLWNDTFGFIIPGTNMVPSTSTTLAMSAGKSFTLQTVQYLVNNVTYSIKVTSIDGVLGSTYADHNVLTLTYLNNTQPTILPIPDLEAKGSKAFLFRNQVKKTPCVPEGKSKKCKDKTCENKSCNAKLEIKESKMSYLKALRKSEGFELL